MKLRGKIYIEIDTNFESDSSFIILKLVKLFEIMNFTTYVDEEVISFKKKYSSQTTQTSYSFGLFLEGLYIFRQGKIMLSQFSKTKIKISYSVKLGHLILLSFLTGIFFGFIFFLTSETDFLIFGLSSLSMSVIIFLIGLSVIWIKINDIIRINHDKKRNLTKK